jgi:flagellar motor switch protein FliG
MQANQDSQSDTSSLRKAAILFRSLDADAAAKLLAQLDPHESQQLRAEIRDLGIIEDAELGQIVAELQRAVDPASDAIMPREGRLNTQLADLRQLAANPPDPTNPFQSLSETDIPTLLEFFEGEQPQIVAVVLSKLPAKKAAEALAVLSAERQTEVVERLVELGDADPESLRVVEQNVGTWLGERNRERQRRLDRMSIVGGIMAATQTDTRQAILVRVGKRDREMARQIEAHLPLPLIADAAENRASTILREAPMASHPPAVELAFDDLVELPTSVLSAVLTSVDSDLLRCALAGASDELLVRILQTVPRRQRKQFRAQIQSLGPTSLRDVDDAQRMIAELASRFLAQSSGVLFERLAA